MLCRCKGQAEVSEGSSEPMPRRASFLPALLPRLSRGFLPITAGHTYPIPSCSEVAVHSCGEKEKSKAEREGRKGRKGERESSQPTPSFVSLSITLSYGLWRRMSRDSLTIAGRIAHSKYEGRARILGLSPDVLEVVHRVKHLLGREGATKLE